MWLFVLAVFDVLWKQTKAIVRVYLCTSSNSVDYMLQAENAGCIRYDNQVSTLYSILFVGRSSPLLILSPRSLSLSPSHFASALQITFACCCFFLFSFHLEVELNGLRPATYECRRRRCLSSACSGIYFSDTIRSGTDCGRAMRAVLLPNNGYLIWRGFVRIHISKISSELFD